MTNAPQTPTPPLFLWKDGWACTRGPYADPAQLRADADEAARQYPGETIYVMGPFSTVQTPPPEPLWDEDPSAREAFWSQVTASLTSTPTLERTA